MRRGAVALFLGGLLAGGCGGGETDGRVVEPEDMKACLEREGGLVQAARPAARRFRFSFVAEGNEGLTQAGTVQVSESDQAAEALERRLRPEWERAAGGGSEEAFFREGNVVIAFDDVPSERVRNAVRGCAE